MLRGVRNCCYCHWVSFAVCHRIDIIAHHCTWLLGEMAWVNIDYIDKQSMM